MSQVAVCNFWKLNYEKILKKYGALYVCETSLDCAEGGWTDYPITVFYSHNDHKYYGFYRNIKYGRTDDQRLMYYLAETVAVDASQVVDLIFDCVVADNGEIIYSRYTEDYRISSDKSVWIDGGRDYTMTNVTSPTRMFSMCVHNGKMVRL